MTNKTIFSLTGIAVPLAGTEVIPIWNGVTTTKVTVANLTAGRAVSCNTLTATGFISTADGAEVGFGTGTSGIVGNSASSYLALYAGGNNWLTLNATGIDVTSNISMSTAAKGINFTANTPAAGMTSQLLNWYEEGTWTPTPVNLTVTGSAAYTGRYTRTGRLVYWEIKVAPTGGSTTASTLTTTTFTGLPFTVAVIATCQAATGAIGSLLNGFVTGTTIFPPAWTATGADVSITGTFTV